MDSTPFSSRPWSDRVAPERKASPAAYVSVLFAIIVAVYGIVFTRNLMDLARRKYVVEEGIFAA